MGVLASSGYNVREMNVTDYKGYISSYQEAMLETVVNQRAICLVNGLDAVDSFLNQDLSLDNRYTIDGTSYSFVNGRIVAQDFRFQTRVRRNSAGQIIYDPTTAYLPNLVSSDYADSATTTFRTLGECF